MLSAATVVDLDHLRKHPTTYGWFDFRPGVKKLVLAGSEQREHVAILWYPTTDGAVSRHYHAMTESVYVIDGSQADEKGVYRTGTVYFNPPGSGHAISESTGFFILAYASAPDFVNTGAIQEYTPVSIDTAVSDLTAAHPFTEAMPGVRTFEPDLGSAGGLRATFVEIAPAEGYFLKANYLLVLKGSCDLGAKTLGPNALVVGKEIEPQQYRVVASAGGACVALGVRFESTRPRLRT